jgi:hypothetical protein
MRPLRLLVLAACAAAAPAQLTTEQKLNDFRHLAGLYAKQYAPYEWKRELFGFDALDIGAWLERASRTGGDLEFYDLCVEYVASLRDTHAVYSLPSNFTATLSFTVDIYDGKALVDSIDRTRLRLSEYPFEAGDELVSVDGKPVEQLLDELGRYAVQANARSTRRRAASRIVTRPQRRMPRAPEAGEPAAVVVRRAAGAIETYRIPWTRTGVPLQAGPVPTAKAAAGPRPAAEDADPAYLRALLELQTSAAAEPYAELGSGARAPIYAPPTGFVPRLGRVSSDFFYSGTFPAGDYRVGYVRIPSYDPASTSTALQQFDGEIAYFQENTDGLVVDQMRNPGGSLCFGENIVARLTPYDFRPTGYELRVTWSRVNSFYNNLTQARNQNADPRVIELYEALYGHVGTAYRENRGRTGPVPLCGPEMTRAPATDRSGKTIAYTRPLLLIVDEFSTSTADSVAAMLQDARRAILFGMRTNGAGGTNTNLAAGAYSEGAAGMTVGLMTRAAPAATPDYPTTWYIENAGVRPDLEADYMTRDNLMRNGRGFVEAFTRAIAEHIRNSGGR